jgi:hypothetical protein
MIPLKECGMNQASSASNVKGQAKKRQVEAPKLEIWKQINLDAAGLDVGASQIYVCVPEGALHCLSANVLIVSPRRYDLCLGQRSR